MDLPEKIRNARLAKGWSQADLARQVGISQATVDKVERGLIRQSKHLPRIVLKVGIPMEDITAAIFGTADIDPQQGVKAFSADYFSHRGPRDFPVYASAEGGPGEIIRSTDPVDFLPRPAPVEHVKEAYGLLITGESMWPEYRNGETAMVNPKLPPMPGEAHIFYAETHGEARASIKTLQRVTAGEWIVSQHNPKREFGLVRKEWRFVHRVFGKLARL